jgi:hypothetical protein
MQGRGTFVLARHASRAHDMDFLHSWHPLTRREKAGHDVGSGDDAVAANSRRQSKGQRE